MEKCTFCYQRVQDIAIAADLVPLYLQRNQQTLHSWDLLTTTLEAGDVLHLTIPAKIMEEGTLLQGFIDIPHGWNDPNVNCLTDDQDVDPVGGFPNLKIVPVRIEKMNK